MVIAITGCIGSGKSYILNKIHTLYGYDVFSSDEFVRLSYKDKQVKEKLNEKFNCIVDGNVDKSIIKRQLNESNINELNAIIHPFVIDKIIEVKENYKQSLAFIEVPLLFESNLEKLFDYTISISVEDLLRHNRLKNRSVENYNDMIKLEKYQLTNQEKAIRADFVLNSLENDDDTLANLNSIIKAIVK